MNNKDNSQDDFILAINNLIKETNLNEFEELKDSIDNINSEANKIIKNSEEKNQEKFDNN
ncbi:MAG: hypothetical protein BHW38_03565 [Firmicutes bacterium CAG:321_26_22]|nr:MAG: hypothetical protein BHW38_03565 [Firmicutes bacterium CAG:321_26_22]